MWQRRAKLQVPHNSSFWQAEGAIGEQSRRGGMTCSKELVVNIRDLVALKNAVQFYS